MPLDQTKAVNAAYQYLQSVTTPATRISNVRVEEVVKEEGSEDWKVTLSYDAVGEFAFDRKKEYKDFKINESGLVVWMKIRNV